MCRRHLNRRGFTLPELMVGAAVGAITLLGVVKATGNTLGTMQLSTTTSASNTDLVSLYQQLLKVGRAAYSCSLTGNNFTCAVDLNVPPTGVTTPVTFTYVPANNQVLYYMGPTTGNPNMVFNNIGAAIVCGDSGTPITNPCAIETLQNTNNPLVSNNSSNIPGYNLSWWHYNDLQGTSGLSPGNFYRFYLLSSVRSPGTVASVMALQGSFWVRNVSGSAPVYQWGTR